MGCGSKRPSGGGAQHLRQVRFRQEEQERKEEMLRDKQSVLEHGRHPYGVQPMGNMYASATPSIRPGLGWFGLLGDQAVLDLLEMLDAQQLGLLTCCSRVLYVFCHHDEVWRSLVLRLFGGQFEFKRSWKDTLGYAVRKAQYIPHLPREIAGVYSDLLFQPWLCSSMGICHEWLERSNIPRRSNLSVQEFIDEFEAPNRPVIITDAMSDWPAMHKWTKEALLSKYGEVTFAAGSVDMRLDAFCRYSDAVQEERPLYLFDKNFTTKCPDLAEDYWIPAYFTHDLFSVLGTERPDWRWLIIGPARSGSAFHVDPNQTSAWNAVITGRKKWIMWPPHYHPPGVWPSEDGSTTTSNASITEWFLNWYPQTQTEAVRPLECVQEAGELIFVPRGWWHCVLNLEPCIAVTQNYVSEQNVLQVLDYMRQSPQCVSGVPSHRRPLLLSQFTQALKRDRPGLIERLEAKRDRHKVPAVSLWDNLVPAQELKSGAASSFTFSFGE
eukprot:CAMPEP_0179442882 /NCGR_PEP_ID=MMETSP0799-20121207/26355_1 /TAXON_ID=46947 /ORGANISM="Geminigera cryophila, Strain CCMP2564" /LENGTH=494 /DNA_ID=CAMNT_0021228423 /DNA_START=21 /DNA_END=1505 /DNA_ORIENTATION=-